MPREPRPFYQIQPDQSKSRNPHRSIQIYPSASCQLKHTQTRPHVAKLLQVAQPTSKQDPPSRSPKCCQLLRHLQAMCDLTIAKVLPAMALTNKLRPHGRRSAGSCCAHNQGKHEYDLSAFAARTIGRTICQASPEQAIQTKHPPWSSNPRTQN